MPMTQQHGYAPPHWLPYFTGPSCDGAIAKVRELGGDAMAGPIEVPAGRISVLRDPQGAAFGIFEGETAD
jgi:predicted enzyme related to lactoylglutathione lyase